MKAIFNIIILVVIANSSGHGQNTLVDSLLNKIKTNIDDSSKIHTYHELFFAFQYSDTLKAASYLKKAMELSLKTKNKLEQAQTEIYFGYIDELSSDFSKALNHYTKALELYKTGYKICKTKKKNYYTIGIGNAYLNIGLIYYYKDDFKQAIKMHWKGLNTFKEINHKEGMASEYMNIAIVMQLQGNYANALKYDYKALTYYEEIKDELKIAGAKSNIGIIYYNQAKYKQALKFELEANAIYKKFDDITGLGNSFNNLGNIYYDLANYEKALIYYNKGLEIDIKTGNPKGQADSYNNIGIANESLGKKEEALNNYFQSITIKMKIDDKSGLATSYNNVGLLLLRKKELVEAKKYFILGLEISREIGMKEIIRNSYRDLHILDSITKNYTGAIQNLKLYLVYRDSLSKEESKQQSIQTQLNYEFDKKKAIAIAAHKKEIKAQLLIDSEIERKQNLILLFVGLGVLVVLLFSLFIYRSLKLAKNQTRLIELQKIEVEHQKEFIDKKQKEIIDSILYAKRIQIALLPQQKTIHRILKKFV